MTTKLSTVTPLFIFEMANNHGGCVEHGLEIIRQVHAVTGDFPWKFAFKFQYRDIDTFIHRSFKDSDLKYVRRFQDTRLSQDQFRRLKDEAEKLGFVTICTPFDEPSVDLIEKHGFDVVKIASCSFNDWPLLERVVKTSTPIIASTAGQPFESIDNVVSFFQHRDKDLAIMHCVAAYPTPADRLALNQIDLFRARYPEVLIGYSTHEPPDQTHSIGLAVAKGAVIFEKHVNVPSQGGTINAYSATPPQIQAWLEAARRAYETCGPEGRRYEFSPEETASLRGLRRGAFARNDLQQGQQLTLEDLSLAIPTTEDQLTANDLSKYIQFTTRVPIKAGAPIMNADLDCVDNRGAVRAIIDQVKRLIANSNLTLPRKVDMEISHHYGIDQFHEYGITMLEIVNRAYCKKLLVMLSGQFHPEQYHKLKEETFHILHGQARIAIDGNEQSYSAGDVITVEKGAKHSMRADTGLIMEEISTTHRVQDSFYTDPAIMANSARKTRVTHWLD